MALPSFRTKGFIRITPEVYNINGADETGMRQRKVSSRRMRDRASGFSGTASQTYPGPPSPHKEYEEAENLA
jgi:hypothetical protein